MKLSILTTITNPEKRMDPYKESLRCYNDLADEVIIVDGSDTCKNTKVLHKKERVVCSHWPEEWSWDQLPKQLNIGLDQCSGDWVIKLDIDQLFHEKSFKEIRNRLEQLHTPVATFQKYNVLPSGKYMEKGEMIAAINLKEFKDKVKFGRDAHNYTDLCLPIFATDMDVMDVPIGSSIEGNTVGRTGISFWNFDYFFKTKEVTRKEFFRFSKAHERYFGTTSWGRTEDDAFKVFLNNMKGRFNKAQYTIINSDVLPKYIRERYDSLTPDMFGYNGWGLL